MYSRDEMFLRSLECYFGANTEIVRHSSTYIILYLSIPKLQSLGMDK